MTRLSFTVAILVATFTPSFAAEQVKMFGPEESLKKMEMQPGYSLEVVLAEPVIKEPVLAVFDGNGRMYVAEMRTYMQDADGTGKFDKVSVVSRHEDTNGDGKYDKHTVFADKLLLPRMILPLDDRVVIGETNSNDLYVYRDTNGDGVADEKKLWYKGGRRGGNLEHQPSGLVWCMDNWIYTTYNAYRYRFRNGKIEKEDTDPNGGQWGVAQDNYGKPWFNHGGAERGPVNFQQPVVYAGLSIRDETPKDWRTVWPIDNIPDTQGGRGRLRKDNTLNHFTATCGVAIYRGDRLPEKIRGDLFFAEPVGRLIRRGKVTVKDGVTYLENPYKAQKSEFMRSTDPNFRPVNAHTAPDGTLYFVDMYRGIIQEGSWTKKGSYLRGVIEKYGLQNNIGHGRIYRLRHKDFKPGPQPRMLEETPAQLVAHLEHPNGWWRDTAQKLLILKNDKSVASSLKAMATNSKKHLARIHALWTLEGLQVVDAAQVRAAMKDPHPQVRRAAIRVSETLYKAGDKSLEADIRKLLKDKDPNVVIQALLTLRYLGVKDTADLLRAKSIHPSKGVSEVSKKILARMSGYKPPRLRGDDKKFYNKGAKIFNTFCFSCHGADGKGQPLAGGANGKLLAPGFVGSKVISGHPGIVTRIVLHGLEPPKGKRNFTGEMVPMNSYDDEWVASVVTYIRSRFGNDASWVRPEQVAAIRAATKGRKDRYTREELEALRPKPLKNRKDWKLSASHNQDTLKNAVDGDQTTRYDTGTALKEGMWIRIELPKVTRVEGLVLDGRGSDKNHLRKYVVRVSKDGKNWSKPVSKGNISGPYKEIFFDSPQKTRFIKIISNRSVRRQSWSIHELDLYGQE